MTWKTFWENLKYQNQFIEKVDNAFLRKFYKLSRHYIQAHLHT